MTTKRRALIVHTGGGLGDVLLSGPVIDAVSQAGYEVDFLARKSTSLAVAGHRNVGELLTIDGKDPSSLKAMRDWAARLKAREYELCFLLWSTSRWAWTLYLSSIPKRVGQDSRLLYSFLFTHRVRIRSEHGDDTTHWTEILLDYPRAVGIEPPEKVEPRFSISEKSRQEARQHLHGLDFGSLDGPLIGFHSGKGLELTSRRWPVERFAQFARELQEQLKARLILTGGPQEVEIVEAISSRLQLPHANLSGKTSLPVLAALAEACDLFVCPDSGPMHLAAAVKTPVVGIYALDEDFPRRWAPFGVPHRIIRPPRPACPPGCKKPTCPNFSCYLKVQPSEVVEAAAQLLARHD